MRAAAEFLGALGRALSAQALYVPGHPARDLAADQAYEKLVRLQESSPRCSFTFLGDQVLFGDEPLRELESWDWAWRLGRHGVQRLELTAGVTRDELLLFLEDVTARVSGAPADSAEARFTRQGGIRYGAVGLARDPSAAPQEPVTIRTARVAYNLREEAAAVRFMHDEVSDDRRLPLLEAEAVV
ncbi:MAG TPA: hypothetical protein VFY16_13820, partial [Gemmatimonadaceae bacterium]|nr:hypothetical protein [Gemmatimonadaceae bacterium]